jgi:C1A family cysteine protease
MEATMPTNGETQQDPGNTPKITAALRNAKARWTAADTPVSRRSAEERRRMLGAVPPPRVRAAVAAKRAAPPRAIQPPFDPEVDWRNHHGINAVTSVKDQGGCGSCVSFACCGAIESMTLINSGSSLDLAEADSHFCSSHGATCAGWWPDECLDQIIARGVCDEGRFLYATAFPNGDIWANPPQCILAADRDKHAVKIVSRVELPDPATVKNYLTNIGPVAGCFTVYDDFYHYKTGVYHHVTGNISGGHCVLIIGYSEKEQCWIGKNSWNSSWGDNGFFKIAYSDMIFDEEFFPMYGATV